MNKPPIGIMPRSIWLQIRLENLGAAIARYAEAGEQIPIAWIDEYNRVRIAIEGGK